MKDRILFWCDRKFMHFGIAKSLQEKYDCELFAIIQLTDRTKEIFREQQLVKFNQIWIFNDYVSKENQNFDLNFLKSFEEKYKINLWKIAYTDVSLGYNKYHKFTRDEILSLFTQECKLFEEVLDKVKPHFLAIRSYDNQDTRILVELCKARGIKILMTAITRLDLRWKISDEEDYIENYNENYSDSIMTSDELQKYLDKFASLRQEKFMAFRKNNTSKNLKSGLSLLLFHNNDKYSFLRHGRTRSKIITKNISSILKKKYRASFINKNCTREINENEKFVYFPLQYEPERTIYTPAPFYTNQLEVITNVAKSLPVEYKLYVKEHPGMQVQNWRTISYYKQIMHLPNVRLIHTSADSKEIIKKCSLVVTVAGSSCLEAAFYNKPSIVFADVSFSSLPSVYRIKSYEDLPQTIRVSLQKKVDPSELGKFIYFIDQNSFEFDMLDSLIEVDEFYNKGLLSNNALTIQNIESCLEKRKPVFDMWALEYIKKINELKNIAEKI